MPRWEPPKSRAAAKGGAARKTEDQREALDDAERLLDVVEAVGVDQIG